MKKLTTLLSASIVAAASQQAVAADLTIEVQNLTQGLIFHAGTGHCPFTGQQPV